MIIIYITAPNKALAKKIAKVLIDKKLVACVNFLPIESVYCWKGKKVLDKEVVMICKTRKGNYEKVKKEVKRAHPYEVPCIISWNVDKVNVEYLSWVIDATKK